MKSLHEMTINELYDIAGEVDHPLRDEAIEEINAQLADEWARRTPAGGEA